MAVGSRIGQVRPCSYTKLLRSTCEFLPVHQRTLVTLFLYVCLRSFTCETQIMEIVSFIENGNLPAGCLATQQASVPSPPLKWSHQVEHVCLSPPEKHTCVLIVKINNKYKCCRFNKEPEMCRFQILWTD